MDITIFPAFGIRNSWSTEIYVKNNTSRWTLRPGVSMRTLAGTGRYERITNKGHNMASTLTPCPSCWHTTRHHTLINWPLSWTKYFERKSDWHVLCNLQNNYKGWKWDLWIQWSTKFNFFLSHELQQVNLAALFNLNSDMYTEFSYQAGFQGYRGI